MFKLSLIVPCYNEEENIEKFYNVVKKCFDGKIEGYELVFVNDGSRDRTMTKLKEIYKNCVEENVKVIGFSRNFGKEAAIYAGMQYAQGEYTTIIDADLQQLPNTVLQMVDILDNNEEIDCVAAFQEKRSEGKVLSFLKNTFYRIINKMTDTEFIQGASDFRTFRGSVKEAMLAMSEYHRFSKGIFSWVGFETKYIPYLAEQRNAGTSKWSFKKLFKYGIDGIVSFSVAPLKLAVWAGIFSALISILYMIFVICQKILFGIDVPGHATLVTLILFMGGVQMFFLGILGEYISKMYIQEKNRPIYVVKDVLGVDL